MSTTKLLPTTLIVPIASKCFDIKQEKVKLEDNIFLRAISQDYIMPIALRFRGELDIDDIALISRSDLCLFHEFSAPQVIVERSDVSTKMSVKGWKEWSVSVADKKMVIIRMLRAFIFTKAIDLWIKPLLFIQGNRANPSFLSREYINMYRMKGMPTETMGDDDIKIAKELYGRMKKLAGKAETAKKPLKLVQAITFFWVSQTTENIDLAFTTLVTSLEALLLTGRRELKHKLAERVAFLLGGTAEEKIRNHILLSEIYDIRSKIVHGEKHLKGDKDIKYLHSVFDIARKCIRKTIIEDDLMNLFSLSLKKSDKFEKFFRNLVYGINDSKKGL